MTFFSIFTAKISDDLFPIFPFSSQISRIFATLNVLYDPFLIRKTTISENNSFMTPFFTLFLLSRASDNTILLKILGGRMHGPSPTSNFGGTVPPGLLARSPPLPVEKRTCKLKIQWEIQKGIGFRLFRVARVPWVAENGNCLTNEQTQRIFNRHKPNQVKQNSRAFHTREERERKTIAHNESHRKKI